MSFDSTGSEVLSRDSFSWSPVSSKGEWTGSSSAHSRARLHLLEVKTRPAKTQVQDAAAKSLRIHEERRTSDGNRLSTADLYRHVESDSRFTMARRILAEVKGAMDEAVLAKDPLVVDNLLGRVRSLLAEAYCLRDVGRAFGTLLLAVFHAVSNLQGRPPSPQQMEALRDAVDYAWTFPQLSFDRVVEVTLRLEDLGFNVHPAAVQKFVEEYDGKGFS